MPVSFFSMPHSTKISAQPVPRKRFGQNFLADQNILHKIVRAAELTSSDVVLEIGPGMGHLTRVLADTHAQVAAVEVDRDLLKNLRALFAETQNVHLLEGDILQQSPSEWLARAGLNAPYSVVANIPYYITSAILRYLLEADIPPTRIVVMVQREVAQHLIAQPPRANLLGVSVQYYGVPRIVGVVPAGAFYPRPQVDSAIVRVDVTQVREREQAARFFRIVRAGFGEKRKQLGNALAHGLGLTVTESHWLLTRANIEPIRRAETLTVAEWEKLALVWDEKFSTR